MHLVEYKQKLRVYLMSQDFRNNWMVLQAFIVFFKKALFFINDMQSKIGLLL